MNKSLISAKRVFAIIGIVMGSVLAFVGAVFGVMAAMGKFKTPQVYPTHLQFETEKVIVAGNAYGDPAVKADIYSFQLSGTNASVKHEVNKKVCYIWFEKGSDLITLCDVNGVPLERNSNNRYKVNCNEPIYYMVNKVANNYETDGIVVITARSENDKVKPDDPFTLYIDRKIETIYLTYGDVPKKGDTQNITVGVDIPFDFNYVINPNLAQNPITHADYTTKVPVLYYVATGYSTDYVEVTETEVNNINSPLNKILTINNGKVTFKSTTAGSHQFKIAVFPTYEAKNKFNADKLENQITNYDKLTNYMTVTTLNVNVENIDINNVQLLGSNVVLNLYSENDYITLDGTSGVAGAKDNNLELKITKGEGQASIADYTRFDEVVMGGLQINENVTPTFKDSSNNVLGDITITKDVVKVTNLNLGELGTVIDYINYNGNIYYCDNGMAVMKEDGKINLITHGAYLDFYIHNSTDGDYEFKNLNYSATALNSGKAKSWNLISKELLDLEDYESLHLGIIVVNSQGVFNVNKLFDTIPVTLNEVALDYQIKLNNAELNVTYNDKGEAQFAEKTFNDFVTINSGSYNSTVFVTDVTTSMIKTFNNVTFKIDDTDTSYVLVGYKDKDGNFVNSVKVNSNVSNLHNSCKIYMLQLKNEYKQSVNDIITKEILESGKEFDQSIVRELFNESNQAITINSKYVLNPGLLTVEYYDVYGVDGKENKTTTKVDNVYQVFENTNTHRIVISSTDDGNMLDKVATYYAVSGKLNLLSSSVINIEPKAITYNLTDKKLIIDYDTKTDISTEAYITLSGIGTSLNFGPIKVLSGDPDNIIFNAECVDVDGTKTLTLCDIDELETATSYIRVKVSYESDKYVYTYYFVEGDKAYKITSNVFNTQTSNEFEGLTNTAIGFHGAENKEQTLNVTYESAKKELFDFNQGVLQAYKHGKNALIVTIGDTTKYVGFEIDASGFALKNKGTDITDSNSTIIADENPTELADILTVNYNNTTNVPLTTNNYVYINDLFVDNYGDGTLTKLKNADGSWSLIKSTGITDNPETDVDESVTTILTIDANNEYSFDYTTPYIPLEIRITVQTIVGVKEIKISFTSSISVSVNDKWKNSRVFYADTSVLLYSTSADAVPVFDITSEGKNIEIYVSYGTVTDEKLSSSTFEVKDKHIGEISIEIFVGGNSIHTYTDFVVKPNVIATLKTDLDLKSNTTTAKSYSDIYIVKKYKNKNITYGSSTTALYTNLDNATETPTGLTLGFKTSENGDDLLSITTDGKLTIGHMQDLNNTTERTIYLMYDKHIVSETVVTISNNYTAQLEDTLVKDGIITLMAKTNYTVSDLIEITTAEHGFTLDSIEIECGEVLTIAYNEDNEGKTTFSIDTFVSNIYNENVNIIFTFKNGDKTLTYNTSYNNNIKFEIVPFKPTEDGTKNNAYSGAEYDLLKERYNIETLKLDTKVKSLIVTNIYDENGVSIKDSIIKSGTLTGYIEGADNPHCLITFNEIVGSAKLVKVEYTITYADEKSTTYVYTCDLTINNRQTINTPQYPEKGLTTTAKFKFVNNDYAKEYSGSSDIPADGNYQLTIENYEPILINSQAVLNLKEYDNIKHVNRIVVNNVVGLTLFNGANNNTNLTITPIAYESVIGMANYFNNSVKITNDNEITFEADTKGLSGLIIFKVSTVSGNYAYYVVRVCSSSNTNLSLSKNVDYTLSEGSKTYKEVIDYIDLHLDYSNIFGRTYDNSTTSLYLYNTETLTADGVVNTTSYIKIEDTATITRTEQYQTITIGLLYSSVRDIYIYGTITIYVQPQTTVSATNTSQFVVNTWNEKPNGKYTASVDPSAETITCPFNGTWTAKVVNINNDEYSADNKYGITYNRDNENEITLANRVTEDTTIVVRYTRNNGTVVEVTYTYLKTSIPEEFTKVVGEFKDNKFNNTVELNSTYLGTYANNITVSIGDETFGSDKTTIGNVEYNPTRKVLTFTQTHTQQVVDITITYNSLKDAKGNAETRTFRFVVKEGVYVDDTSTENGSGLANARRKLADVTNAYIGNDALTGSKLEFSYIDKNTDIDETTGNGNDTRDYYIYKIGGLIIYTVDNSYLELTVATEDQKYITNLTDKKVTIDADKQTINFVHLATTKDINITINVLKDYKEVTVAAGDSVYGYYTQSGDDYTLITNKNETAVEGTTYYSRGEKYAERTFYATIAKTYTNIVANYVVKGATHENVVKGTTNEDIHTELLGLTKKFALIGTVLNDDGKTYNEVESFNLIDMGFDKDGNPNYIDFSCNANGVLKYTYENNGDVKQVDIKFNEVDKNTMCVVYLNNQAGLTTNSVTYNYQIMATTSEDGLNYSNSSGIHDSTQNYLSFVINDNKDGTFTSEKFIIGSMYDTANKNVFNIDGQTSKHIIVDGKTDANYTIVGGYKNAIQYEIQASTYKFYITANFESGNIELIVVRGGTSNKETQITYNLNASGVNGGTNSMIEGLNIIVFNYDIALNNPTETIYSGFIVDLTKKISVKNNGSTTSAITYEIDTAESSYTVGGTTYNNESAIVDMGNDKTLIIKTIGYNFVLADLTFNIKQGNYIVDKVKYTFTINKNMHFVANGGDLTKNLTNNNPSTNLVLTKDKDGKFPIEIKFVAGSDLKDTNYKTSSSKTYYNVLAIDLYIPYDGNSEIQNKTMDRQNIKISLHSNHDDYVTVTNSSITFNKDFTGDIELLLTVNTGSAGTYSVVWNVNVSGILAQEYIVNGVNSNPDYNRVNSSSPFVSGTQVQLFTTESSSTKSGVKVTQPPKFTTSIQDKVVTNGETTTLGGIELTYSYKIIENNSTTSELTNKQLFTNENNNVYNTEFEKGNGGGNFTFGTGQLFQQIALPSVPSTDEDTSQTYFVVYMFYLKYLGLTYDEDEDKNKVYVFYVTYEVINYQNVKVYNYDVTIGTGDTATTIKQSSASVDVDNLNTADNNNFLDLFYYKETLTISSGAQQSAAQSGEESTTPSTQEYSLTYSNKTIKFTDINGRTADITNKTEDTITFTATGTTDDNKNYKYNKTTRTLFVEETGEYKKLSKMEQTPNDKTYHSVFNSGFTNIFDYAAFINTYLNKESVLLTDTKGTEKIVDDVTHEFTLTEKLVENKPTGRYGIELGTAVLFKNEMLAELALLDNGIKTITVPAYSSGETSGFRLYTENAIVANTKNAKGDEGIELSSIFLITHFTKGGEYYNDRIIGVGAPDASWVNSGTADTTSDSTTYATIQIPSDNGNNTYYLKRVTYTDTQTNTATQADVDDTTSTGTSTSKLYSLEKSYYYLAYGENTKALVVPDYIKAGLETTWFKIQYNPIRNNNDNTDYIEINLTNAVKVWSMETITGIEGKLKLENSSTATYADTTIDVDGKTVKTTFASTINLPEGLTLDSVNKKIIMPVSALDTYKINYPEATDYPMITATIKVNDNTTLKFNIEFMLDSYVKVEADFIKDSSEDIEISLVETTENPEVISIKTNSGYEVLSKSEEYFLDSTNNKLFKIDGATKTEIGTWTNGTTFTAGGIVYQLIKEGATIVGLKAGDETFTLEGDYFIRSNLGEVTSIVEKGGNGYGEYNKDNGNLVLDGEKLKNYFDNTSKTQLKIIYTISTAYGSYDFQVVVNETLQQNG